jgi:hypothetical protein
MTTMANILTATEAANVLRCDEDDPLMLDLLPAIDAHIRRATGHNWAADNPVLDDAKAAARMLLVMWHEDRRKSDRRHPFPSVSRRRWSSSKRWRCAIGVLPVAAAPGQSC